MTLRFVIVIAMLAGSGIASAQTASIVSRVAADNVTVRAIRIATPLRIDGRLDEEIYRTVDPIDEFIQQEPSEGPRGCRSAALCSSTSMRRA